MKPRAGVGVFDGSGFYKPSKADRVLVVVTDYDVGLEGDPSVKSTSHEGVVRVFDRGIESLRSLIAGTVKAFAEKRGCECGSALRHSRLAS